MWGTGIPLMEHPTQVGKYQIERFLGGGMSHVYRAKDTVLGRAVALKILTSAGSMDSEAKARFLQEARMASNIRHENIISVFDFGEEKGRPFIVMEFLEGESLRDVIKNNHAGDLRNRLRISLEIARALDYIHARKIIHRDIKPENIHIDLAGKVKLMDFGIAKSQGVELTRAGFTLGTPYYMAPEQVLGQPLTPQADLYAFGVLMFELFSGQKPVSGDTVEKIFAQILYAPLDLAPLRAHYVPEPVCNLIARLTAKQPASRPPGLGVVCEELEHFLDPSRPAPRYATPPPSGSGSVQPVAAPPPPPPLPSRTGPISGIHPSGQRPAPSGQRTGPPSGQRPISGTGHPGVQPPPPGFVGKLPPALRSTAGLMLLAGLGVVVFMCVIVGILKLLNVI